MWQQTTQASNWIMTELFGRDVRRLPGNDKMPPMAPVYLYPELRQRWPDLPSRSVSALENTIQKKYRAVRYAVIWTAQQSLPTFRYPVPFPIPAQGWSAFISEEKAIISAPIGSDRFALRLKGGPRYRRQRRAIEQMASGEALIGEMAIYRSSDDTMAKLVAWLPRREGIKDMSGALRVRTAHDCLLIAANDKDDVLWRYNADHLKRWIAEHDKYLQRLSEDQKYEQRPIPAFADRRKNYAEKYIHRMHSACHEISAQLANYAARRKFAAVLYDDTERGFVPQFQYFKLQSLIQEKLDAKGIEFALASTEVQPESPKVLAEE
jgi:hypothetical protein